jgi:type II secretory ATPase GspE/PulE/Tfp pilus assembly ATPase PilB-like protein
VAVLAQRLVRLLCKECRDAYPASREDLAEISVKAPERPIRLCRAALGAACNYTGYRGRMGIFELMLIDDDIRALVSQNVDSKTIKHKAIQKGMHTLRADGAVKVLKGVTSVAEVLRATEEEGVVAQI